MGVSRVDSGKSIGKSRVSLTFLSVSLGSLNKSKMGSSCLSNLRGNLRLRVEDRSNQRCGVECRCNTIIYRGNRETRVLSPESKTISNIGDLLELASSINIRVTSTDSTISVANLLLDRVQVGISVVKVAKLILGMELATSRVGGSIRGNNRSSSNRSSIGSNNWGSIRVSSIWISSIG